MTLAAGGGGGSLVRVQPFKGIYVTLELLGLVFVRIPWWTLKNLLPTWRPRRTWTLGRVIQVNLTRFLVRLDGAVGGLGHNPTYRALEAGPGVNGVWIDPVSTDLVTGEVKKWADVAGVESVKIPGYWYNKVGEQIEPDARAAEGEKVFIHFHGGGYVVNSAHPSSLISAITRDVLKKTPSVRRALSVEYRLTGPGINPFPAQLLDGLAGFVYLVSLGFEPANIVVVGDSAGAHLALGLTRYILKYGSSLSPQLVPPGGLVLLSPWSDTTKSHVKPGSSLLTNAPSDFLAPPHETAPDFPELCLAGPHGVEIFNNEFFSPGSKDNDTSFVGFPRAIIVYGGTEIFVDPIRTLEERMVRDLGRDKVVTYFAETAFHDFIGFTFMEPERTQACIKIGKWIHSL